MAKGNQKTVSGEKAPANVDNTAQTVKPLKNSKDASVVQADAKEGTKRVSAINGGLVPSASSVKPSGLRVPSPKIGFFDGVSTQKFMENKNRDQILQLFVPYNPARSTISIWNMSM